MQLSNSLVPRHIIQRRHAPVAGQHQLGKISPNTFPLEAEQSRQLALGGARPMFGVQLGASSRPIALVLLAGYRRGKMSSSILARGIESWRGELEAGELPQTPLCKRMRPCLKGEPSAF